jgi:hypothetical protein
MRKLKLQLDDLAVESFGTLEGGSWRGTVQGFYTVIAQGCDPNSVGNTCGGDSTCEQHDTCAYETCGFDCGSARCGNSDFGLSDCGWSGCDQCTFSNCGCVSAPWC